MIRALLILLLTVGSASAQMWPAFGPGQGAPAGGGGGGGATNYTSLVQNCWVMGANGDETDGLEDKCGATNMEVAAGPARTWTDTPPAGTASGKGALNFTSAGYLDIADAGADPTDWTLSCWVFTTGTSDVAISKNDGTTHSRGPTLRTNGDPFFLAQSSGTAVTDSTSLTSVWHHGAMTYNSTTNTTTLYRNGISVGTPSTNGIDHADNGFGMTIASYPGGANFWVGQLYECWWDDSAMTQAQICEIAMNGLAADADVGARTTLIGGSCE